jgi:hypothetical protein
MSTRLISSLGFRSHHSLISVVVVVGGGGIIHPHLQLLLLRVA